MKSRASSLGPELRLKYEREKKELERSELRLWLAIYVDRPCCVLYHWDRSLDPAAAQGVSQGSVRRATPRPPRKPKQVMTGEHQRMDIHAPPYGIRRIEDNLTFEAWTLVGLFAFLPF